MNEPFFMVWCPEKGLPTHKHSFAYQAWDEAERLAKKHQGHKFFVLRSIGECAANLVQRIEHADDTRPF